MAFINNILKDSVRVVQKQRDKESLNDDYNDNNEDFISDILFKKVKSH